jgi:hypothetical protein
MINIVIPSYQRSDNVITLNNIPASYKENTYLYVRHEEYELYKHYEDKCNIIQLKNCKNIGDTRQYIVEHMQGKKIWMIDDDIQIHKAFLNEEQNAVRNEKPIVNEEQFYDCLKLIENYMNTFYHGHLRLPIFPKGKTYWPARVNTWGFTNAFFNLEKINVKDIDYKHMTLCEDMYVFLSLIEKGYDRISISEYQVKGSPANAKGGCSTYRTVENHNAALEKIHELFPAHTKWSDREYDLNLGSKPPKALKIKVKGSCNIKDYKTGLKEFL